MLSCACAQNQATVNTPPTSIWGQYGTNNWHILSLAHDSEGNIWLGTERYGLWLYTPPNVPAGTVIDPTVTHPWKKFTQVDGLGDNDIYAMTKDQKGRLWVGHRGKGVSVWNGSGWKNYDALGGAAGTRVFSLTTCPTDGDVWMATNMGLTRYSLSKDTWTQYAVARITGGAGVPVSLAHIRALSFDASGNLYAGTEADGLLIGSAGNEYRDWRSVRAAPKPSDDPEGKGLPSDLINAVLAGRDGVIWVGTDSGLAYSRDGGTTWRFLRGADWQDKIAIKSAGVPRADTSQVMFRAMGVSGDTAVPVLLEDYVTCLAEDAGGQLYIGFRHEGYEVRQAKNLHRVFPTDKKPSPRFVRALLVLPDQSLVLGEYSSYALGYAPPGKGEGGIEQVYYPSGNPGKAGDVATFPAANGTLSPRSISMPAAWPTAMRSPTAAEMDALRREVRQVPASVPGSSPTVTALEDDWTTEGDWLGRYGRYWACLAATVGPENYVWGAGWDKVSYDVRLGPNHAPGDQLQTEVRSLYTDDPRSLEMPPVYFRTRVSRGLVIGDKTRRTSEWIDRGHAYPMALAGPNIYYTLTVPPGSFYLSLYLFNRDGHLGDYRYRDYPISVRETGATKSFGAVDTFPQQTELARARAVDFWEGVYKRFIVQGPVTLTIEVNRNHSYNTILSAAFLDLVDEQAPPYLLSREQWTEQQKHRPKSAAPVGKASVSTPEAAERLFEELERVWARNPTWAAANRQRLYLPLARWYRKRLQLGTGDSEAVKQEYTHRLGSCYYQLEMYDAWEDCLKQCGIFTARNIETALRQEKDDLITGIGGSGSGAAAVTRYIRNHSIYEGSDRASKKLSGTKQRAHLAK